MTKTISNSIILVLALALLTGVAQGAIVVERLTDFAVVIGPGGEEVPIGEELNEEQAIYVRWDTFALPVENIVIDLFNLYNFGGSIQANLFLSGTGLAGLNGNASLENGNNALVRADFGPTPINLAANGTYTLLVSVPVGERVIWSTYELGRTEVYGQFAGDGFRFQGEITEPMDLQFGYSVQGVPEPGTLLLIGGGLMAVALLRRKR